MESGFSERTLSAFLGDLGSNSPAPGGGAAAGVSGALGAALGKMVAELTLGKQKYAAYSETAQNASEALTPLIERFFLLADDDAKAYLGYRNALALPKASEEEHSLVKRRCRLQFIMRRKYHAGSLQQGWKRSSFWSSSAETATRRVRAIWRQLPQRLLLPGRSHG